MVLIGSDYFDICFFLALALSTADFAGVLLEAKKIIGY